MQVDNSPFATVFIVRGAIAVQQSKADAQVVWILVLQMKATDRELYFRYVDFSEYSLF